MAEITSDGYVHLRNDGSVSDWFIEIRDDGGSAILRVDDSDPRCTISDDAGSQTLTFEVVIDGDDGDLGSLPTTIESSVLFDAASGGNAVSAVETFTPFTFGDPGDQCTVRHHVEAPQQ